MKKIFALLLALCLLCAGVSALAETAAAPVEELLTEEKALELDGFSLLLGAGEYYYVGQKAAGQIYVQVLPFYGDGDYSTNYNATWSGNTGEVTADDVKAQIADFEDSIRTQYAAVGITVDSFTLSEPYDASLSGVDCVAFEMESTISYLGQSLHIYQREIWVGSIGYIFTLTASSPDDLDKITQKLAEALVF